jgi:isochorismate synthase EntC
MWFPVVQFNHIIDKKKEKLISPIELKNQSPAKRLEKIQKYTSETSADYTVPWLGGVGFSQTILDKEGVWQGFPNKSFFLPKFYFTQKEQILTFTFSSQHDIQIEEVGGEYNRVLRQVVRDLVERPVPNCDLQIQPQTPSADWLKLCAELDKCILNGDLQKVVPAQIAKAQLSHFEIGALIERLNALPGERIFKFAYRYDRDVFLGASPELLFEQDHRELFVPAVAGTRVRNLQDSQADAQAAEELKQSTKEQREHRHVVDFVRTQLAKLGANLPPEQEPELLALPTLLSNLPFC